jgi:hypothetical protein
MIMTFPAFFRTVPPLILRDPLAELLGAAEAGLIEYRYEDVVKLAGHSCPTVAGAWLMARHGLAALYPDGTPLRGNLRVDMRGADDEGTTGVVGSILGMITGAAGEGGFKGLGGAHARCGLLRYGQTQPGAVTLTRLDERRAVTLDYFPEIVPPAPEMPALLARLVGGTATEEERLVFARLWQDRVRRILVDHGQDTELVRVRRMD